MRLLFIRHAIAIERDEHKGDDLYRPLSKEGEARAKRVFSIYKKMFSKVDVIISSKATRAIQTAKLLNEYYDINIINDELLNPDTNYHNFIKLMKKYEDSEYNTIAIVGHEPDFSEILSHIVSDNKLNISIKKASCIEIDYDGHSGVLKSFITPKMALSLYQS